MNRTNVFLTAIFFLFASLPCVVSADYLYPGSAAFQPLAVLEPATPDSLSHSWTGDLEDGGLQNLGLSLDFLRNAGNSEDWDVIFAATGSFRYGERFLLGITAPYIIRDPDLNQSDLLDLRFFARMRLMGKAPSLRVSGELSAIFPTAGKGDPAYPFTLDSPVMGARLAFAGGSPASRAGATVGYQKYLATESGTDYDLLYSVWMERDLEGPWSLVGEVHGSKHTHSGAPGNDEISDDYFQVGVRRISSERFALGLAAGTGISGDAAADLRMTASATFRFGTVKAKVREEEKVRKEPEKKKKAAMRKAPAKLYTGITVVMIAEGVADTKTEKRVTKALQQRGYATGMDPGPEVKIPRRNVLLYNPGMQEQAIAVSRSLVMGGYLKELHIEENRKPITQNWLLLLLGGER